MTAKIAPYVQESLLGFRAWINRIVDSRWDHAPFGTTPHATRDDYLDLFKRARTLEYPDIDALESRLGFAVDRGWLDELALHTQIVKKKSDLGYPHGRLLYSLLRRLIADQKLDFVTAIETGTARGFSAVCMAKALADAGIDGRIITVDVLSHVNRQIWNCIDDHDGPKSRAEILAPWADLTRKILFLQGDTLYTLPRLGLDRIHFAFLDAQHIESSVLAEFNVVAPRQQPGDLLVFDDVTPNAFPGVVKAVDWIERQAPYQIERLAISERRAYAWAKRTP